MSTPMDYTRLSLDDVKSALDEISRHAQQAFGGLDARQLNWRPDERRWSVGQCLDHLLTANRLMFSAADAALDTSRPRSLWTRVPLVPRLLGSMLIRSQAPGATRKFSAPAEARPAVSAIAPDIIARFVEQHREAAARVQALDPRRAQVIMTSPFARIVTYSVQDGWRLVVAHDHRHLEQARRVTLTPGFPAA